MHPGMAIGGERVFDTLIGGLEHGDVHLCVLLDVDDVVALLVRSHEQQLAELRLAREVQLLIARRHAIAIGNDPDLQEMHRLRLRVVELAMANTRARTHLLHIARTNHRARTETISMRDLAIEHIRDDLHVAMSVRTEAAGRRNAVVIDHA